MNRDVVAVAVFAKAPIAGYAKTRLIPRLGAEAAAALQRLMIERSVRSAVASRLGPVSLWCAPDRSHEVFANVAEDLGVPLHCQSSGDLGARMLAAFEELTPSQPLVLIGSDCPALGLSHLLTCAAALQGAHDAVFIPTEDGGYALVAAANSWPELFHDIPSGSAGVMDATRRRAKASGPRIAEPVTLWDRRYGRGLRTCRDAWTCSQSNRQPDA